MGSQARNPGSCKTITSSYWPNGLWSGNGAAIHFLRETFEAESTEAAILVDASNAFNSINRAAMLHNMQIICPPLSTVAINMYRVLSRLILSGGQEIASCEGTTQGDNLAMALYALGTSPVLNRLRDISDIKQVWLAEDAAGAGELYPLRDWWDAIVKEGHKYGYFVNGSKSWLI